MEVCFENANDKFNFKDEAFFIKKGQALLDKEGFTKNLLLNVVWLDDEGLLEINRNFLNHDYYTDIITFPIDEDDETLEADIYISVERVEDNAKKFLVSFDHELLRVYIHGLLHLVGYGDKSEQEQIIMREKEVFYIDL